MLDPRGIDQLRVALADYTPEGLHELVGLAGQAALSRGDLDGLRRALPADGEPLSTLARLFLLGAPVPEAEAARALAPLPLAQAVGAGLLDASAGEVTARLDIRPYGEQGAPAPWWVLSDFGSDVRRGPLAPDHVLGVGTASLTLAQATMRAPVGRALDLGTGCGVQALHLARHAQQVVGTDISPRALRLAATTAALSGQAWDLRAGSLLEPVTGERFDLVVANPPFVISPGLSAASGGYDYRDSGWAGDELTRRLLAGVPRILVPGGAAQLLANWIIPADGDWAGRLTAWLAETGCHAWVWQRSVAEPGEYVTLWLRDAGESPGTPRWRQRYDAWLDWFLAAGIAAVGMGLITLWDPGEREAGATPSRRAFEPVIVCEDVPQLVEQPCGAQIASWLPRQLWLRDDARAAAAVGGDPRAPEAGDDALAAAVLRPAPGLWLDSAATPSKSGWRTRALRLRQSAGMRWEVEIDDAMAAVVAGCDGRTPLRTSLVVLAAALGHSYADVLAAAAPVVRDLVMRGFLEPVPDPPGAVRGEPDDGPTT